MKDSRYFSFSFEIDLNKHVKKKTICRLNLKFYIIFMLLKINILTIFEFFLISNSIFYKYN